MRAKTPRSYSTRASSLTILLTFTSPRFEGLRDENGNQILQPTTAPEDFEFFVCEQGPLGQGKGDPVYSLGYIASTKAAGYCITASALQDANATFVSKPCKFTSDKEISLHQNFQFVDDS